MILSDDSGWSPHIPMGLIHRYASQRLYFLRLLKRAGVASIHIVRIYVSLVRSLLKYVCQVWHILTVSDSDRPEGIQKRVINIAFTELPYECALTRANINTLHSRREDLSRRFIRDTCMLSLTHKLNNLLPPPRLVFHNFRKKTQFPAPRTRTKRYQRTLIQYSLVHWQ